MTSGWRTRRTILTESISPEGEKWVARDDVSFVNEFLRVPEVEDAATETRAARAHFLSLIDAAGATYGGELALPLDDAMNGLEVAARLEVIARLLGVAMALEPDYGAFIATPSAAAAVEATPPVPLPEWYVRRRGRRVLMALGGAFVAGVAVRSLVSRLA